MSSFAGQVALITGAAQGIGRALAHQLAAAGAKVAAVDLQAEALEKLNVELAGKPIAATTADVTDRANFAAAVKRLEGKLGPVDLLIANAGIGRETAAVTFSAADIEEIIRVNLIGVVNSIEAVLPGMIERRRGHIAALSSMASYRGLPKMLGYCASKAGVNALLDGMRVELKPYGIGVTTICPAWIRTQMTANISARMKNILEVDDAARLMLEAVRRRRPMYTFPASAAWRVRLLRWLPAGWSDWMVERHMKRIVREDAAAPVKL